jgi:hypothetical protein
MTEKETAQLLAIMGIAYQTFTVDKPKIAVWHKLIGDLDYTLAELAIQKLIIDSPYPPTIHDIRKRALEVQYPNLPTPAEAWGVLNKNIQKYGSYRVQEGLEALPPIVRETVDCMGYREICQSEEPEGVLRAQFMRMYEQILNRRKGEQMLPELMREQIKQIAGSMPLMLGGN